MAEKERQIADLEQQVASLEQRMTTPEGAADVSLFEAHGRLQKALDAAMEEWEAASGEVEQLKASAGQVDADNRK